MQNKIQKVFSMTAAICLLTASLTGCSSTVVTEVVETTEMSLQMSEEIVLGTVPPTEESIPNGTFSIEDRIVEQFSKDELVTISYIEEPASDIAEAFIQIQLEGYDTCLPLSDGISYDVSEGESINLEIVRCLWTPEENMVYIGLYDPETETGYAYAYVGGNTQVAVPFHDLPAGEYVVYIKNMGERTITDGTLRYRISPLTVDENQKQSLQLDIVTNDAAMTEIPLSQIGGNFDKITYLGISSAKIDINGTQLKVEDAILGGYISVDEIISYARFDARNGFCEEIAESENGLTKFTYRYSDFDFMYIYDLYETPDGEQYLISEIAICELERSPSFLYMDDETGKPIDYENWGLMFDVMEVYPDSITVECTQSGGQQIGDLIVRSFILYEKNPDGETEEYIEPLVDEFLGESDPNIVVCKEGTTELSISFLHQYGELSAGEYVLYFIVKDEYSEDMQHSLMRNYYDEQFFAVPFTIE